MINIPDAKFIIDVSKIHSHLCFPFINQSRFWLQLIIHNPDRGLQYSTAQQVSQRHYTIYMCPTLTQTLHLVHWLFRIYSDYLFPLDKNWLLWDTRFYASFDKCIIFNTVSQRDNSPYCQITPLHFLHFCMSGRDILIFLLK